MTHFVLVGNVHARSGDDLQMAGTEKSIWRQCKPLTMPFSSLVSILLVTHTLPECHCCFYTTNDLPLSQISSTATRIMNGTAMRLPTCFRTTILCARYPFVLGSGSHCARMKHNQATPSTLNISLHLPHGGILGSI